MNFFYRCYKTLDTFKLFLITVPQLNRQALFMSRLRSSLGHAFLIVWFTALMTRFIKAQKKDSGDVFFLFISVVLLNLKRFSPYSCSFRPLYSCYMLTIHENFLFIYSRVLLSYFCSTGRRIDFSLSFQSLCHT